MRFRRLVAPAVACAVILSLAGCESGGVDAISASSAGTKTAAPAGEGAGAPKVLPASKRKSQQEAPGPLPPPDV
ncbi:hypothetical protein [Paludisphaera soli]|uniref:hypothetical protein n=1 Tax=Paludisphaera soli TaxID=2712865 RepID=UPI0013E9A313|nr:hypothetical protein [Paludisphaera soli]